MLKHLSKTNPTRINGIEVTEDVILKNRDEISIAERKFIFETGETRYSERCDIPLVTDATMTEEPQGVLKAVAVDSIDDCITVDYSRNNPEKRRRASVCTKNPATQTLASTLARSKTESKPSSTVSLPITKAPTEKKPSAEETTPPPKQDNVGETQLKIGLPTPVKRAIQSRRKSISFDLEKLQEIQLQTPQESEDMNTKNRSTLAIDAALDKVIAQHQNKLQDELRRVEDNSNLISVNSQSIPTIDLNLQTPRDAIHHGFENSVMKTPLKREIHARRITRSAVKVLETSDSPLINPAPHADIPNSNSKNNQTPDRTSRNNQPLSTPTPVSEPVVERRVTRQSLKTPLKNAIQSRRKSLVTAVETLDKVLDDPLPVPERSALKTPLKKAIQARRKSYAAQVEALDNLALTENVEEVEEIKEEDRITSFPILPEPSPVKEAPRALISPLRKAIEMRRKSLQLEVTALNTLEEQPPQAESESAAPPRSIRMSLKRAINSRRKSLTQEIDRLSEIEQKLETSEESSILSAINIAPPALPKPLLDAIESRRYNLKGEVKILDEMAYLATHETAPSTDSSTERHTLKTPIRKAIQSRRKSYSHATMMSETNQTSTAAIRILHTPLRQAIQSRRKSLVAEIASLQDSLNGNLSDSFSYAAASISATLESDRDLNELSMFQSPLVGKMGVEYEANQLCARLSIASYASSIGKIEVLADMFVFNSPQEFDNADDALADALECFLEQPDAFYSPRRGSITSSGLFQGESLLSAIAKKGSEYLAPISSEMIADIMSSITDDELAMIDEYSKQLVTLTGMEDEEAYARCLDAYIQGVEAAIRLNETSHPEKSLDNPTPSTPGVGTSQSNNHSSPEAPVPISESTIDFVEQKKLDLQLIMAYADDLEYSANLRPDIAYGIALDTYLADPFSFRQNVKAMKVDPSTPIEWVEYEEERYYQEEEEVDTHLPEPGDDIYEGETENECDEPMHSTVPMLNLPSPITEEIQEEKLEVSQAEDAERLVADGPLSPLVSPKLRGRKRKEPMGQEAAAATVEVVPEPVEDMGVLPVAPVAKKRGRVSKAKPKDIEETASIPKEETGEIESMAAAEAEAPPGPPSDETKPQVEDATMEPEPKKKSSRKGMRGNKNATESSETDLGAADKSLESSPPAADPSQVTTQSKTVRGRKKAEPVKEETLPPSSDLTTQVEEAKDSEPSKPSKGGRGKRKAPEEPTPQESEVQPSNSTKNKSETKKTAKAPKGSKKTAVIDESEDEMEEATAILCDGYIPLSD